MKPYYQDSAVTIYHGDCREIAPTLRPAFTVVSDPPYGIGWQHSGTGKGLYRTRSTESVYGDAEPFRLMPWLRFKRLLFWGANHWPEMPPTSGTWLVWDKAPNGGPDDSFSDAEFAWTTENVARNVARFQWKGIANIKAGEFLPRVHPTQKPVALMSWCIARVGGDSPVLDPYMGSGTTLRAAKDLGRKAIGIEIEERYCEIAAKRMQQEVLPLVRRPEPVQEAIP